MAAITVEMLMSQTVVRPVNVNQSILPTICLSTSNHDDDVHITDVLFVLRLSGFK
jgi:hypothetical protein